LILEESKLSSDLNHGDANQNAVINPYLVMGVPQEEAASLFGVGNEVGRVENRISESAVDALCAVLEMKVFIDKERLDLRSAINLVVSRTQELTRANGVAVGVILQGAVTYPARAGVAAQMGGLHFQDNLFLSCFDTRRSVLLRDAHEHPEIGARFREEGIASVIIVPIFHDRQVAGGIELLFKDRRTFAATNVEDLELIADVIGEGLSGKGQEEMKLAAAWGWRAEPKAPDKFEPRRAASSNETAVLAGTAQLRNSENGSAVSPASPAAPAQDASEGTTAPSETVVLDFLASKLAAAPVRVSDAVKRAWSKWGRGLKIPS
jgi:hypothetical protein